MLIALVSSVALAGSGPWVLGEGDQTLYIGADAERITRLAYAEGSGADTVIDVDSGLSKYTTKAIFSYGLLPRMELELRLGYGYNTANRRDGPLCTALGQACAPTTGLEPIVARARYMLLDEVYGPPVTLTIGGEARFGQYTDTTRNRITNVGEGTFDAAPVLFVGRAGGLGKAGYWSASVEAGWRYRFPRTTQDDRAIPGWETFGTGQLLLSPVPTFAFGPEVDWFYRPNGINLDVSNPADPDWLAGLRVEKVAVGGVFLVRSSERVTFVTTVGHNVWAVNNPTDALLVSVGFQVQGLWENKVDPEDSTP